MVDLTDRIIEYLLPRNDCVLYLFLFFSAIFENLFPPVPGDTITVFGAFLVGIGRLNYLWVYLITTVGSVIGFMMLYGVARYFEREFFIRRDYRFFSADSIISAEKWFAKYGYYVVLANRFFPGIRSVTSIVSGISRLSFFHVFALSLVSAAVWNAIWIRAGYLLGNNWDIVKKRAIDLLNTYNITAGIIIAFVIIIVIVYIKVIKGRIVGNE